MPPRQKSGAESAGGEKVKSSEAKVADGERRRSGRVRKAVTETATPAAQAKALPKPGSGRRSKKSDAAPTSTGKTKNSATPTEEPAPAPGKKRKVDSKAEQTAPEAAPKKRQATGKQADATTSKKAAGNNKSADAAEWADSEGRRYWLMKAEPESRLEKGIDVKFSIDDLRESTEPEPWDGVRNPEARNNMIAMRQGELAFFYHSNCKTPGIVGVMEIVEESAPDDSAFDPKHPYYDPKSDRENPKWHCVHVGFKEKFPVMIPLDKIKALAKDGGPLSEIQLVKRSRLSVCKVSPAEWTYLTELATTMARDADGDD